MTQLLRMAPGATLPDHEHVLIEQTYVMEGSLVCGEGECKAGSSSGARRAAATRRMPGRRAADDRDVPDPEQVLSGRRRG